jgi:hypothetical protein
LKYYSVNICSPYIITIMSSPAVDEKIMADLKVVNDKMDLCDSMLRPSSNKTSGDYPTTIPKYDSLMGMIGYLEACAPRMVELVEAAAQGLLSEPVLMKCLDVNDRLTTMLSNIDKITFTEAPAVASAAAPSDTATNDDLLLTEGTNDGFDDFDAFLNERTGGLKD